MKKGYCDLVLEELIKLDLIYVFSIKQNVKQKNRADFIELIKWFIRQDIGAPDYYFEFTNDYSAVRRFEYIKTREKAIVQNPVKIIEDPAPVNPFI